MDQDNNYKIKLSELVSGSGLTQRQKEQWELFLKISHENENEAVYEAANEGDDCLKLLTKHLNDKIRDMNTHSRKLWQRLAS